MQISTQREALDSDAQKHIPCENHASKIHFLDLLGQWFEPRSISCLSSVMVVFRKTVVGDWHFDHLSSSHLQSEADLPEDDSTTQVVKMSATTNSLSESYSLPDNHTSFKQLTYLSCNNSNNKILMGNWTYSLGWQSTL